MIEKIEYNCLPGGFAIGNTELLSQYADLYSNHYGKWEEGGIHPNENIKLSENRICEWLDSETVSIYYATHEKNAVKLKNIGRKNVPFITDNTVFQITNDTSVVNTEFFCGS